MPDYASTPHFFGRRRGKKLRRCAVDLLETLLPRLEIALPPQGETVPPISDPQALFATPVRQAWLEVGFGGGEHVAEQAQMHPDVGIIASEPFINGVASLLGHLNREQRFDTVRIVADDVRRLFPALPDGCLSRVFVLFPDPWPKARHAKRRFIGPDNLPVLARLMHSGAELRIASDDPVYQAWVEESLHDHPDFTPDIVTMDRATLPADWPQTRYERKAIRGAPKFYLFRRR